MDIVIHGTKGGRKIFTPNKLAGLLDVNSDSPKATSIGQKAYAIRLLEDKLIFSQYKIIRDVRGDKRTGFVGFSLFIQKNKKLKGSEILTLLDSVSDEYSQRYIADNNLSEVTENWDFLDVILSKYETTPQLSDENIQSGEKDDAFIYFNGLEQLISYFDAPYQEEYQPYRQILFINKELEGKPESPLNALRNTDVDMTGKIDLENPKYKILFNTITKDGVRVSVKVNGLPISSGNKFRRKDELEITWTKQYYKTEILRGKCYEIDKKRLISINPDIRTATINEFELDQEELKIVFEIKDKAGKLVSDAEILFENQIESKFKQQEWKKIGSSTFSRTFKGDSMGKQYTISVRQETLSGNFTFVPERIFDKVVIFLEEKKVITVIATDSKSGRELVDFDIFLNKSIQVERPNQIVFVGDQLNAKYTIRVRKSGYQEFITTDFEPLKFEQIRATLIKSNISQASNYNVNAGKYGTLKNNKSYFSNRKDGRDVENIIKPNRGYEFANFEFDGDNTIVAQYKKKPFYKKPVFIAVSIVLIMTMILGIWKIIPNRNPEPEIIENRDSISNYLQGNELIMSELVKFKTNWENHLSQISQKQQDSIKSVSSKNRKFLSWLFDEDEETNNYDEETMISEDLFSNDSIWQKIIYAIELRDSINTLNFEYLKKQEYSDRQNEFKESIKNIKSEDYELIKDSLLNNGLSYKTLDEIADLIVKTLDSKQTKKDASMTQNTGNVATVVTPRPLSQNNSQTSRDKKDGVIISNPTDNITIKIIRQLQGNDLKIKELNNFQTEDNKLQKSIILYLDFWDKVKVSDQKGDFDNLLKLVRKDVYLKESKLKTYLNKICKDSPAFETLYNQKINRFKKTNNSTLNDLENLN
jgi:hypothetical protein